MNARLELAGVTKSFGPQKVLDDVWIEVRGGEAVGLVGANGAGKTTMLRIAAGLVVADRGTVRWSEPAPRIRYFGGEMTLPPQVQVGRWAGLFGVRIDDRRSIGQLSRGNRQFFGLRIVLAGTGTDLILLDEPWEGLDPAGTAWLTSALRRWRAAGAGILISSHRLHDLDAVCTRFVLLQSGRCHPVAERERLPRVEQLALAFAGARR
ncbi:MAG TPA: ATP-binding cassette domain-containing protein [Vicinamibacterales bacterium]|nr:ATP-binding cassette domain-containing protein [Vicinamibacterales bacterium]